MTNLATAQQLAPSNLQLPVSAYFDADLYQREIELLFKQGPGYVGHELMVPEIGSYQTLGAENEGRILVRNKEGVELLSNVCRHRQALMLGSPLWENRILGYQRKKPIFNGFILDKKATIEDTREIMQEFDVRAPGPNTLATALSGGNQQKFIVGREMVHAPKLLVASHPTRGVDVGAQGAIWEELRKAREKGMAIVLISADLEELIGMSDRLLVMLRGEVTAELDPATTTPEKLGAAMTGAK